MLPLWARVDLEAMAMKGYSAFPNLQHYWNLTIRLLRVISRILIWAGSYPTTEKQSVYSTAPANWASDERDETINPIKSECSKLTQKVYKTRHDWVDKLIHMELCKKLKFEQIVYAQSKICLEEWDVQTPLRFWDTNGSSNLGQTTRPSECQQNKKREPAKWTLPSGQTTE